MASGSVELQKLRTALIRYHQKKKAILPDNAPLYDPERDGVTFSVLTQFKLCRELARLGLKGVTSSRSSLGLVFGNIGHATLQTVYTAIRHGEVSADHPPPAYVHRILQDIEGIWRRENPRASIETMNHLEFSMTLAEATLPTYFKYWGPVDAKVKWLDLEKEFRIPIQDKLPSGRLVNSFVRGKMDGNFRWNKGLWLFETKTKYNIQEETIEDILPHEAQVGTYLWAMQRLWKEQPKGVRYNLIRRPQLRQRQKESTRQFALRCAEDVRARPDWYFMRMDMAVDKYDMSNFEGEFADLRHDFFSWWYGESGHYKNSSNCDNKYGRCDMLRWCGKRDSTGLYVRDTVFRELEEV